MIAVSAFGVPRWIQIPFGLLICPMAVICLVGSATLLLQPSEQNPIVGAIVGTLMMVACFWELDKGIRLMSGRKTRGGLIEPTALRAIAMFYLLVPVVAAMTGQFARNPALAVLQAAGCVFLFFAFNRWAKLRAASVGRPR